MDLEKFIYQWNNRYPLDHYFRKKYGIPFGSKEHREMNQIDIALDMKEQLIVKHLEEQQERAKEREWYNEGLPKEKQIKTTKEPGKTVKMTKKEVDKEFEALDLSQFNEVK